MLCLLFGVEGNSDGRPLATRNAATAMMLTLVNPACCTGDQVPSWHQDPFAHPEGRKAFVSVTRYLGNRSARPDRAFDGDGTHVETKRQTERDRALAGAMVAGFDGNPSAGLDGNSR